MAKWRVIYKDRYVTIGMWERDNRVYFTLENLTPDDVIGQDVEFGLDIESLETILSRAKEQPPE